MEIFAPTAKLSFALISMVPAYAQVIYYTDTGTPSNPLWSAILPTLNNNSADPGPVAGSGINVSNGVTEVGLYGDRTISVGAMRLHVCCNTSTTNFGNFSRWFQTDGKTQVFRLFVNDENTATDRGGTSRVEAFTENGWNYSDNKTFEWTGRYTIACRQQGYAIFQVKNDADDWAMQLNMTSTGSLLVNNRRNAEDVTVKNPDGTTKDFDGKGFDVRILDDGRNYKCWIDGVLYADNFFTRTTTDTDFRWGKYLGSTTLTSPSDVSVILVSGAQVKSWSGLLTSTTTDIAKANNTQNLQNGGSWSGGVTPGIHNRALWNSGVTTANTATLAAEQDWAGIKITSPGGLVTIDGSSILGLDDAGIDMSTASQNLVVNCPVELNVDNTWNIAASRTATFFGEIRGYGGITLSGSGTVSLRGTNTFSGPIKINAGVLQLSTGGSLNTASPISVASGATFLVNQTVAVTQGTHFSDAPITGAGGLRNLSTGTLTLTAANAYSGPTTISAGTLELSHVDPFDNTSALIMSGGTLLQPTINGVTIHAPITVGSTGSTTTISGPNNAAGAGIPTTLTLAKAISGNGGVAFTSRVNSNTLSTVLLNAPCTYLGTTELDTAASIDGSTTQNHQLVLKLGIANALPTTTVLTLDGGNGGGSGRFTELNLNGHNQQLAGLTNIARNLRVQRIVNSNVSSAAILTIHNTTPSTFSGSLGANSANGSVSGTAVPGSSNGNNFGLSKNGSGTFSLTSSPSYSGNTTVHQGTLSFASANANNQSSTVTIASTGGTLNLAFAGTDTVDKLFIGSTQMKAGVYEAVGNPGAGIEIPQLTGSGTLTVITGPIVSYASWKTSNNTSQPIDGDHDGDGVANGIEYFLSGDSDSGTRTTLPSIVKSAGLFSVTWTKGESYPGIYGTDFIVETSTSLAGTWVSEIAAPSSNATVTFPTSRTVTYTFPATGGTKRFVRLKVLAN